MLEANRLAKKFLETTPTTRLRVDKLQGHGRRFRRDNMASRVLHSRLQDRLYGCFAPPNRSFVAHAPDRMDLTFRVRPATTRTFRGDAIQIAAPEMMQQATAKTKASL